MQFMEFFLAMVCLGILGWYCHRVTRVNDVMNEMAREMAEVCELDNELYLAVARYVQTVLLPELSWHDTMKRPDDERTIAAKELVAAIAARTARTNLTLPELTKP